MNKSPLSSHQDKKLFLRALHQERLDRPPFWFMRQAGRYLPEYRKLREDTPNFLSFCYSPALTVEAALQPLRRFQPDAAILFSDILVIPDGLGQSVRFEGGVGPVLEPIRSETDLKQLQVSKVLDHLEPVFESVRQLSAALPHNVALIGFAGSPWTVAYYMVEGRSGQDGSTIKKWAIEEPDGFQKLIDILVPVTTDYLIEQIKNGAETIQLFDSWSGLLEAEHFDRWIIQPTREIVAGIKQHNPDVPVIGFPRGAGDQTIKYAENTGVDGIGIDSDISPAWARDNLQGLKTVQGNLDNQILREGGKKLEDETINILQTLSGGPFIFNLGHGILPETPPDNVIRVAEIVRGHHHAST
ncbi:MAG: uroporphyrinogen decarboxylase [Rhodospirillaceae bacterium]